MIRGPDTGWIPASEGLVEHVVAEPSDRGYGGAYTGNLRPAALVHHVAAGWENYFHVIAADGKASVSAHIVIAQKRDAAIQFVSFKDAAYQAGRLDGVYSNNRLVRLTKPPTWSGFRGSDLKWPGNNPNTYTLGFEHCGLSGEEFPEHEIVRSIQIGIWLWAHQEQMYGSKPLGDVPVRHDTVIGHYEIAPGSRAYDPGPTFPWDRWVEEVRAGVTQSVHVAVAPDPEVADLAADVRALEARIDRLEHHGHGEPRNLGAARSKN